MHMSDVAVRQITLAFVLGLRMRPEAFTGGLWTDRLSFSACCLMCGILAFFLSDPRVSKHFGTIAAVKKLGLYRCCFPAPWACCPAEDVFLATSTRTGEPIQSRTLLGVDVHVHDVVCVWSKNNSLCRL